MELAPIRSASRRITSVSRPIRRLGLGLRTRGSMPGVYHLRGFPPHFGGLGLSCYTKALYPPKSDAVRGQPWAASSEPVARGSTSRSRDDCVESAARGRVERSRLAR